MAEAAAFHDLQKQFAAHIRDPEHNDAPAGLEDRRLNIYRELFFNNMVKLLGGTFPVTRKIMRDKNWRRLIRQFFSQHASATPYFLEVPREFLEYLENEHEHHADDPPFLLELAHYEWVELALQVEESEADLAGIDAEGNMLSDCPVLSTLAWILAYRYPVHRISPDFQPAKPDGKTTFLVVYRDLSDKVGFIEINALTAALLQKLQEMGDEESRSGRQLLEEIAAETSHQDAQRVVDGGGEILTMLHERDVILGTRPA